MAAPVIQTGGKLLRVAEGDLIEVEELYVQAVQTQIRSGSPGVQWRERFDRGAAFSGAVVTAEVVEQTKAPKVIAFKYKRRKGYHRTVGHRRQLTRLKIKTISA